MVLNTSYTSPKKKKTTYLLSLKHLCTHWQQMQRPTVSALSAGKAQTKAAKERQRETTPKATGQRRREPGGASAADYT
jgi:hypothetical protein